MKKEVIMNIISKKIIGLLLCVTMLQPIYSGTKETTLQQSNQKQSLITKENIINKSKQATALFILFCMGNGTRMLMQKNTFLGTTALAVEGFGLGIVVSQVVILTLLKTLIEWLQGKPTDFYFESAKNLYFIFPFLFGLAKG
jgi:hypothetical protein